MRNCAAEFCILKLQANLEVLNRGDFVQTVLLHHGIYNYSLLIAWTQTIQGWLVWKLYLL